MTPEMVAEKLRRIRLAVSRLSMGDPLYFQFEFLVELVEEKDFFIKELEAKILRLELPTLKRKPADLGYSEIAKA